MYVMNPTLISKVIYYFICFSHRFKHNISNIMMEVFSNVMVTTVPPD
jgi:hypothetical protein